MAQVGVGRRDADGLAAFECQTRRGGAEAWGEDAAATATGVHLLELQHGLIFLWRTSGHCKYRELPKNQVFYITGKNKIGETPSSFPWCQGSHAGVWSRPQSNPGPQPRRLSRWPVFPTYDTETKQRLIQWCQSSFVILEEMSSKSDAFMPPLVPW